MGRQHVRRFPGDHAREVQFITVLRKNAAIEDAACSGGITETGTTPHDLGKDQPQQQAPPIPGSTG